MNALGRPDDALAEIERSLTMATATGSNKYVAKAHALRGHVAMAAGQWAAAERDLGDGLAMAQRIGYPTLIWQCAHALSNVLASRAEREPGARDGRERAFAMVRLAADTINAVAERLPEAALTMSFLSWSKVQAVQADLDRLRRG